MSNLSAPSQSAAPANADLDALAVGRSIFGDVILPNPPQVEGFSELSWLAAGGFGIVWRARRDDDGAEVALKVPYQSDPVIVDQMEAEAEALRSLAHPNIVRLYDIISTADGTPVLVMEFVDGPPLT